MESKDYTLYEIQEICKRIEHNCDSCGFNNKELGCSITNIPPYQWNVVDDKPKSYELVEYLYERLDKVKKRLKLFPHSKKLNTEKNRLETLVDDVYKYYRFYKNRNMIEITGVK